MIEFRLYLKSTHKANTSELVIRQRVCCLRLATDSPPAIATHAALATMLVNSDNTARQGGNISNVLL